MSFEPEPAAMTPDDAVQTVTGDAVSEVVDAIRVSEVEAPADPLAPPQDAASENLPAVTRTGFMDEREFWDTYTPLFPLVAHGEAALTSFRLTRQVPALRSIGEIPQMDAARPAIDAMYRTIVRFPSLHFIIDRKSSFMMDMILIGSFGATVGASIYGEVKKRGEWLAGNPASEPDAPPASPQPSQAPTYEAGGDGYA